MPLEFSTVGKINKMLIKLDSDPTTSICRGQIVINKKLRKEKNFRFFFFS